MLRGASPSSPWAWLSHDGWTPGPLAVKPQPSETCGETRECHVEEEARGTHLGTRQASACFPLCSPLPGHLPSLCLFLPPVKVWSWLCLCLLHRSVLTITVSGVFRAHWNMCLYKSKKLLLLLNAIQPIIFRNLTVRMSNPQSCHLSWRARKPS